MSSTTKIYKDLADRINAIGTTINPDAIDSKGNPMAIMPAADLLALAALVDIANGSPSWANAAKMIHQHKTSICETLGETSAPTLRLVNVDDKARTISDFYREHGRWPSMASDNTDEKRLGLMLRRLRWYHPDVCKAYGLPLSPQKLNRTPSVKWSEAGRKSWETRRANLATRMVERRS